MNLSDLHHKRPRLTSSAATRQLALLLAVMGFLPGAASAGWKIIEKPGELHVANGNIGVVLTSEANHAAGITLMSADKDGKWHQICRARQSDFTKTDSPSSTSPAPPSAPN